MNNLADSGVGPHYYNWHPVGECKDVAQEFGYNLGTAIAYIWRAGRKNDAIVDINKAIRHLEFERARLQGSAQTVSGTAPVPSYEQDDSRHYDAL